MLQLTPATKPTIYFIGVTTAKSSIMGTFPLWSKELQLGEAMIKGIDLPLHAPPELYRIVAGFIKNDPLSYGALVTTHKIDLYSACKGMFDYVDPYSEKLGEVSSLSKRGGLFCAHAKDPISSGLALESFVPDSFWKKHNGEALLLGAGGSSLAMSIFLSQDAFGDNVPGRITIANRSKPRLDSAMATLSSLNPKVRFSFIHSPAPECNDRLVGALPQYSLIVNATGLGKDAPGSPTTDAVDFPRNCLVWEINYRGDLVFKEQAEKQAKAKNLHVEDGWEYFIHGWAQVIAEVFHTPICGKVLKRLGEIASRSA
jgi:shikimate 5-dehydrogenase